MPENTDVPVPAGSRGDEILQKESNNGYFRIPGDLCIKNESDGPAEIRTQDLRHVKATS